MPKRQYDSHLIWGYVSRWIEKNYEDEPLGQAPQIFIYVLGKSGAYYLNRGPKLYWDETVGDGYFGNTDQDALEKDADALREVVIYGVKENREAVMFPTYAEFLTAIGFEA